jgi:hypothetical protein
VLSECVGLCRVTAGGGARGGREEVGKEATDGRNGKEREGVHVLTPY